jgi:hypothetical protein
VHSVTLGDSRDAALPSRATAWEAPPMEGTAAGRSWVDGDSRAAVLPSGAAAWEALPTEGPGAEKAAARMWRNR